MMRVYDIKVVRQRDSVELQARVKCDTQWVWRDQPFTLWYRFPQEYGDLLNPENGDPFVAAFLVPAMVLRETLEIEAPVSGKLLHALPTLQAIFLCWDRKLAQIDVNAPLRAQPSPPVSLPSHTGLFFSLGVDSSYSLAKDLKNPPLDEARIDCLINVLGFDIYLWESERYPAVLANINTVARRLGKRVLTVSTNLREFSDRMADWVNLYHGGALASVALAVSEMFRTVKIAATHTYAELSPLGSHLILDPLWSTESLSFVHDGCEADRLDKIRLLAQKPDLLRILRVCGRDYTTDIYNCGVCPKCIMTMIGLHVAGALETCPTFPHEIDLTLVRDLVVTNRTQRVYLEQLVTALGLSEQDQTIKTALETCLS
jgi:hypothetical protein